MIRAAAIASVLLLCLIGGVPIARAQFDVFAGVVPTRVTMKHLPKPPVPTGFTPTVATVNDTTTQNTTIHDLAVSMSDGSTFSGSCTDSDPSGLTYIVTSTGGCTIKAASTYTGSNDGVYSLTINVCQNGQCLNPAGPNFTLTISAPLSTCTSSVPTSNPPPCPLGITAPTGSHWNLVFDDEFTQDSSIDFTNTYSPQCIIAGQGYQTFCPGSPNLTLSSTTGLNLQPDSTWTRMGLKWGQDPGQDTTAGVQGPYGVWEVSEKIPVDQNYHPDFWWRSGDYSVETDIAEGGNVGGGDAFDMCHYIDDPTITTGALSECYGNGSDLTVSFHTYSDWWKNDGSTNGSNQVYLDGVAQNSPYTYDATDDMVSDGGVHTHITVDWESGASGSGDPLQVKYLRRWQLLTP